MTNVQVRFFSIPKQPLTNIAMRMKAQPTNKEAGEEKEKVGKKLFTVQINLQKYFSLVRVGEQTQCIFGRRRSRRKRKIFPPSILEFFQCVSKRGSKYVLQNIFHKAPLLDSVSECL